MSRLTEKEYAEIVNRRSERFLAALPVEPKRNKFNAKKTEVDGVVFDSKREATRYQELKIAERCGVISKLKRQITYPLTINGYVIASYRSDFEYQEGNEWIVEDTKGVRTPMYKIKKRLMLALYGIRIRET